MTARGPEAEYLPGHSSDHEEAVKDQATPLLRQAPRQPGASTSTDDEGETPNARISDLDDFADSQPHYLLNYDKERSSQHSLALASRQSKGASYWLNSDKQVGESGAHSSGSVQHRQLGLDRPADNYANRTDALNAREPVNRPALPGEDDLPPAYQAPSNPSAELHATLSRLLDNSLRREQELFQTQLSLERRVEDLRDRLGMLESTSAVTKAHLLEEQTTSTELRRQLHVKNEQFQQVYRLYSSATPALAKQLGNLEFLIDPIVSPNPRQLHFSSNTLSNAAPTAIVPSTKPRDSATQLQPPRLNTGLSTSSSSTRHSPSSPAPTTPQLTLITDSAAASRSRNSPYNPAPPLFSSHPLQSPQPASATFTPPAELPRRSATVTHRGLKKTNPRSAQILDDQPRQVDSSTPSLRTQTSGTLTPGGADNVSPYSPAAYREPADPDDRVTLPGDRAVSKLRSVWQRSVWQRERNGNFLVGRRKSGGVT